MLRRKLGVLACLAVGLASLGAEADAEAAKGKNLFGVAAVAHPTASQFERIRAGGVRSVRVQFYWGHLEPSPGQRQWSAFDGVVGAAASAGVKLLPFLYGTPPWVSSNPASPPIHSESAQAAWRTFVIDLANRYGPNGTFWSLHPELPHRPIRHLQLWNEVNLSTFWGSAPNASDYGEFVKLTGRALGDAGPNVDLISAGLIPFKSVEAGSIGGPRYIRQLFRVNGVRKHLDAVAIHPLARSPKVVLRFLKLAREVLDSLKGPSLPIWVTEFGWSTGGPGWSGSPLRATEAQQASRVKRAYKLMRKQRRELRLRRAFYFCLADFVPPNDSWIGRMGLFDINFQPKPAWFAYVRRAGGTP